MPEQAKRTLAAIMFTDMVGFTALMQQDEALGRIKRNRHREVLEAQHKDFNGEIIQYFGDGTLSIFKSSVEALECAMEIQRQLKAPIEVPLRIGIHMGDIVVEEDSIFGDAVNLASRIESFSVTGAVLMSNSVFEQVKSHSTFEIESMGKFRLKNVRFPVEIHALANEGMVIPKAAELEGKGERVDKPRRVVQSKTDNPNDYIITEVFQAMLEHLGEQSPEFAFYNSMKMANMPIDNRMLANFIVQDFPWPIGVELRKLFSGDRRSRDGMRLEQIHRVAEKAVRFYAFCLLAQLWDECKNRKISLSDTFKEQIAAFGQPGFAYYLELIKSMSTVFVDNKITPFLQYSVNGDAKIVNIIDQMVEKRNSMGQGSNETACEETEPILTDLLIELSVLAPYKLVAIKEIKVNRPKLRLAKFNHTLKMLNSQHEDFSAIEQVYDGFSDSHSVILLKDLNNAKEYLNLSPLVVDTGAMLGDRKVPGIKNGIYLYSLEKEGRYVYNHTSAQESAVFNELPSYDVLEAQFSDLKETLSA